MRDNLSLIVIIRRQRGCDYLRFPNISKVYNSLNAGKRWYGTIECPLVIDELEIKLILAEIKSEKQENIRYRIQEEEQL